MSILLGIDTGGTHTDAVRAENFRAMIETGKTYELARQGGRRSKKKG